MDEHAMFLFVTKQQRRYQNTFSRQNNSVECYYTFYNIKPANSSFIMPKVLLLGTGYFVDKHFVVLNYYLF